MARPIEELNIIKKRIEFYRSIPVFPDFVRIATNRISDVLAPICQGDGDDVSFVDAESKKRYLKKLNALKRQAERGIR